MVGGKEMETAPKLKLLLSAEKIEEKVKELAAQINEDYKDKELVVISVLKGAFIFTADLVRKLTMDVIVDFVQISSYGGMTDSSGNVVLHKDVQMNLEERDILIVEDIVDTGYSIEFLVGHLEKYEPASVKVCALTDKPTRREVEVQIDYLGFTLPNEFIVGYGLDYDKRYRHLPGIYYFEQNN